MNKSYLTLGLMSGTSGDGVDASIIRSNGIDNYESISDQYFEYDKDIYKDFHNLKEKINSLKDLDKFSSEIKDLERKITIFHARIIKDLKTDNKDLIIGFHGQTIYHNAKEKITIQLGDANLLNQLTKKKIIFNFRKKDIENGGEGAPLTPLFHQLIIAKKKIETPVCILNIGGISNATVITENKNSDKILSKDIGPGNCLIDSWVRKNSKKKFDIDGKLAKSGETNQIILEQAQDLHNNRVNKKDSYDVSDFDISFARGLSLEDGVSTLTDFTASIISESLVEIFTKNKFKVKEILLCGGGRKNKILINKIKKKISNKIKFELIDKYGINGDFIESQAFGFLAIRSLKKLPISFPSTTGCKTPTIGGELINN